MEARVVRLEEQFARIETLLLSVDDNVRKLQVETAELKGRVSNLPTTVVVMDIAGNVKELNGRVSNLPTTWAMVTTVVGTGIAFAGVLSGIIFGALRVFATH